MVHVPPSAPSCHLLAAIEETEERKRQVRHRDGFIILAAEAQSVEGCER